MNTRSKLFFSDEIAYSDRSKLIDYDQIKLKSKDKLDGGLMRIVLAYIYFFTLASGLIFLLSK